MFPTRYFPRPYFDARYFPDTIDDTSVNLNGLQFRVPKQSLQFRVPALAPLQFRVSKQGVQFRVPEPNP